jgi:hypothetical protein
MFLVCGRLKEDKREKKDDGGKCLACDGKERLRALTIRCSLPRQLNNLRNEVFPNSSYS